MVVGMVSVGIVAATSLTFPLFVPKPLLLLAHHGDVDHWPANSIESIRSAVAMGADGLELDVRRSSTGTFWLAHDEDLALTTDQSGLVGQRADDDLAGTTIVAGIGFAARHTGAIRLATLSSAMAELSGYSGLVMVDFKDRDAAAHTALARLLIDDRDPSSVMVIVGSVEGATGVKSVDRRIRTVFGNDWTWHPDVDAWLADANRQVAWPRTTIADGFGSIVAYVAEEDVNLDEAQAIGNARRWGAEILLTNHIARAIALTK